MADHFDKTRATQRARGSLGASDAAEVDAHARGCAACARLLEEAARAQKDETLSPLEEPTENEPASNTP